MGVDRLMHAAMQNLGHGAPGEGAVILAKLEPFRLHGLQHLERRW
ncbi:MAG: hypothetical protein ACREDV_10640 [Methylocella sp.]